MLLFFIGLRENNFFVAQISMDLYFDRINIIFSETLTIVNLCHICDIWLEFCWECIFLNCQVLFIIKLYITRHSCIYYFPCLHKMMPARILLAVDLLGQRPLFLENFWENCFHITIHMVHSLWGRLLVL